MKSKHRVYLNIAFQFIFIVLAILLFQTYGFKKGLLGSIGLFTIYTILLIIFRWEQYKFAVDYIFMKIFGKPPQKEYWENDKPEFPKVVWRKKK